MDTTEFNAEFRSLQVARESLAAVDKTLGLLERVIGVQLSDLEGWLRNRQDISELNQPWGEFWPRISAMSTVGSDDALDSSTRRQHKRVNRLITAFMFVPLLPHIASPDADEARYSLAVDTCLLAFNHSYFALLPDLQTDGWSEHRLKFLHACRTFAHSLPRAADRFHIEALVYEALGFEDRALENYRQALSATSVNEHEFMTQLQLYWTNLIERGAYQDAHSMLVDMYPSIPLKDSEEMRVLLRETFALSQRQSAVRNH